MSRPLPGAIVPGVTPTWCALFGGNSMTQQTTRSRVLRRVGVAIAAAIAVSTVASTASQAASKQSASKYGGDAKVAIFDTFPGWCFSNNPANSSLMAHRTVFETLFEKTIGGDMIGLLAESATPSADLKTWDIKLRPGITFHDGSKLDADALKLNLDYATGQWSATTAVGLARRDTTYQGYAQKLYTALVSPKSTSNPLGGQKGSGAGDLLAALGITDLTKTVDNVGRLTLLYVLGVFADDSNTDKTIGGGKGGTLKALGFAQDAHPTWVNTRYTLGTGSAFVANIKTITKKDDLTVTLALDRAQNDVPGMLYASGRFVVRGPAMFKDGDKDENIGKNCSTGRPIGTGPFMTDATYTLNNDVLKVSKNPNYWRKDPRTGDKLPYLNSITFTNVKEGSPRAAAVRRGTYDAGQFSAAADGRFIKDLRNRRSQVTEFKSPTEYYPSLWLNQGKTNSPFKSKNARLAVLHCLDRVNYNKVRNFGEGTVARSLVGPRSQMYTTRGFHKFDVKLSKQYLDAWKAEDTAKNTELKFTIPADTSTASQNNAKFLIAQWAKCGIKVDTVVEEAAQIIAKAFNSGAASLGEQNAYDAIAILLFEGTDVSFNLPFVLKNAFPAETAAARTPSLRLPVNPDSAARAGPAITGAISIGLVSINLNRPVVESRPGIPGWKTRPELAAS